MLVSQYVAQNRLHAHAGWFPLKWPQLLWPRLFPLKMNRLTVNNLKAKLDCQSSRCGHSNRTVPSETAVATHRHFREAGGTNAPSHTA